jgi:hypothetical protein
MIIRLSNQPDRIRLIAIEMKGAFGNEGALPLFSGDVLCDSATNANPRLSFSIPMRQGFD